ncbi:MULTISPECIES: hypothetical protein [Duncaniella]|jgi:multisubunit Na+/H+ antiporter MnhC subunit|uniref:Uncharacterized protein n=1 Tax=Duncaniella muris TaxID=2094150 RepID=A0A2V1IQN4_9BACT|nr:MULTISPECIES: hypothetical protein [Duncaniella]NBH91750.1 hypothetical protein [Muribaculaceae bacterium S4]NBI20162.1 hypothetical protein [Muribaculaceae bacterium Z1]ROS88942.1 hypothetical protein EEL34_07220 [Muribaculaceae bacterium Isolate-039 (Harlan)]ROS97984.1 hypothetical protein EEL40_06035 [Muribaculaceae bacterium Isolate-083 (Janvier)]ROS99117.1 hypothetical protein EEL37_02895 [Muribaculaceae bacterium Isolate-077 (Janvier)]ROT01857.1 hypothetical protein EEL41_03400 [Muri
MDTIATLNDKFSWRRCLSIGLLYKKSIIYYLSGSAAVSLLCVLLVELVNHSGGNVMATYSLTSLLVAAAFYFSPIMFARRDDTIMTLLPVKTSEKLVFYLLLVLVVTPAVIESIWYGLNLIFSMINKDWDLTKVVSAYLSDSGTNLGDENECQLKISQVIAGCIQAFALIITGLYVVLRSTLHRVVKSMSSVLGMIFFILIMAGVTGGVIAVAKMSIDTDPTELSAIIVEEMMPYMIVMWGAMLIYGLFMTYRIYRLLATRQAKN